MSATPRTDERAKWLENGAEFVRADFARELERDIANLRAMLVRLRPKTLVLRRDPWNGNAMVPTQLTDEIDALLHPVDENSPPYR